MINRLSIKLACALAGILLVGSTSVQSQETTWDPFARDLVILTDWFEGRFDNEEQTWFEDDSRSNTPEDAKHVAFHSINVRLDLPEFGDHVFYVEEYINDDPSEVIRQRFVTFESDLEAGAIRMQQGFIKDSEQYLGAHDDPSKFSGLKKEDVFFMKDIASDNQCDVFWKRVGDQYEGSMIEKGCRLGTTGEGPSRYSVFNMLLSENKYWRVDTAIKFDDDSIYSGYPIDSPLKMRRASIYECSGYLASENGRQNLEPFKIHNQGGTAILKREADGKSFELLMRKKEYPYFNELPDFLWFAIKEEGSDDSIMATAAEIDSRRVSLILYGEMAVSCNLEGYNFRETLDQIEILR